MFNHQKLKCYEKAMLVAKRLPTLTREWPRGYSDLIDQMKRASTSVLLNIAEGNYRTGLKERKHFFTIARGSAGETAACLEVAHAMQFIKTEEFEYLHDELLQVVKILYKLS